MEKIMMKNEAVGFKAVVNKNYDDAPMIVIFPGGGYHHLSTRESIPVSNKFLSLGYNTTIVYYSVAPHSNYIQLEQAKLVVKELSKEYKDIFVMGFSAGGHLAGLVATEKEKFNIKGMILCYPVISFIEYLHLGTVENFLANGNDTVENRHKYSVDERVNIDCVPCFIWSTKTDNSVPYENTLKMIDALSKNEIFHKYHIFPKGPHGMALADESAINDGDTSYVDAEVAKWVNMADTFIKEVVK